MIVWRFWITLKDNLPQEEIDNFRGRFPILFFEVNGLYRTDIDADTRQAAEFIFRNVHDYYPSELSPHALYINKKIVKV